MRNEVRDLIALGPFPPAHGATPLVIERYERVLKSITQPVSDEEASNLMKVFGPDDCFGLAWALLHLIETAPAWPIKDALADANPLWAEELKQRCVRGSLW